MALSFILNALFRADTKQFESGTKRVEKRLSATRVQFQKTQKQIQTFGKALAGAAVVGVMVRAGTEALKYAERLDNVSKKLGVSTDFIQAFGYAARETGTRTEAAEMGLQRFIRRLGEAQQGTGELLPVIQQYNIALKNADGTMRSAEDVLRDYANTVAGAETQQERLRLAFKAFDSEGAGLVTILKDGAEGLDRWTSSSKSAGQSLNDDLIPRLAEANRELTALGQRLTVLKGIGASWVLDIVDGLGYAAGAAVYGFDTAADAMVADTIKKAEKNARKPIDLSGTVSVGTVGKRSRQSINDEKIQIDRLIGTNAELIETLQERVRIYAELAESWKGVDAEKYIESLKTMVDAEKDLQRVMEKRFPLMDDLANAIENGLVNAAQNGKQAFSEMSDFIIAEIQRMLIKWMLFQAFTGLGGMIGGGAGDMLTSFGNKFGGGKASGGRVAGGTTYLVGERGPELVTMGANGYVTPNDKMGGGGTYYIDARSADRTGLAQVEAAIRQLNGSIEYRAVAATQNQRRRNPAFLAR